MSNGIADYTTEERARMDARAQAVNDSIAMHGGPWGGCEDCHGFELFAQVFSKTDADFWQVLEDWNEHLATS